LPNVFPKRLQLHHRIHSTSTATAGAEGVPNAHSSFRHATTPAFRTGARVFPRKQRQQQQPASRAFKPQALRTKRPRSPLGPRAGVRTRRPPFMHAWAARLGADAQCNEARPLVASTRRPQQPQPGPGHQRLPCIARASGTPRAFQNARASRLFLHALPGE
jgi:hypothetical protein